MGPKSQILSFPVAIPNAGGQGKSPYLLGKTGLEETPEKSSAQKEKAL